MAIELFAITALTATRGLWLAAAGLAGGIVNGVAGGGSLLTFPTLLALGYPPLTANMTSTVGIWPGYLGSVAGFRREITNQTATVQRLLKPAVTGAVVGAVLLLTTPARTFEYLAPWLVLLASMLFALQPLLVRSVSTQKNHKCEGCVLPAGVFLASVYGGYFGAGLGIILLAVLGLTMSDTLARSSGLRSVLSVLVNGMAAAIFVIHDAMAWSAVLVVASAALVGGWVGARIARRLPAAVLRMAVILVGVTTFALLIS